MKYLLVGLFLVGGCAHQTPEQREAERQKRERCARIELRGPTFPPDRPFRVIGPISVWNEDNPGIISNRLRQQACELGADAVLDVRIEGMPMLLGSTAQYAEAVHSSGTAVAYLPDAAPPPAP